ncbi:MAG: hypothetical protein A2W33_07365 [Chloroflexi bacterium RBG_16_52_11]|nr:MAG: hypothetical protein A2W33_07365 [Chloroflexi bacterium RBG_16_52_11]
MKKTLKIAVVINILPSYREGFYRRLFARDDLFVKVYCQEAIPGSNLKTIHDQYPENVVLVKSFTAKNEKIVWQSLPWRECLTGYDVVFVEGNPRYLSHAILATLMKIFRKRVVLWTMAHSFRANTLTENIRLLWSRIFDFLFVYSDSEVAFLRKKGFKNSSIVGMNNGLDQKKIDATIQLWPRDKVDAWRKEQNLQGNRLLLSCARLEPKNKFKQFIQALPAIVDEFSDVVWCVIGGGVEQPALESLIQAANLTKHVRFIGALYDEAELAPWFLSSEILVHPAAIGLSILHAFGYGLPVVTHKNWAHHGPEYSAFEPGLTGQNFAEDDVDGLAETVIRLLRDNESRKQMKRYVQALTREKYNVDTMVDRFVNMAHAASGR